MFIVYIVGAIGAGVGCLRQKSLRRVVCYSTVAGVLSTLGLVVTVNQIVSNYLILSLPFWAVLSGSGLAWMARELVALAPERAYFWAVIVSAGVVLVGLLSVQSTRSVERHLGGFQGYSAIRDVSVAAGELLGDDCLIVSASTPHVAFYSGCSVVPFVQPHTVPPRESLARAIEHGLARLEDEGRNPETAVMLQERYSRQPPADEFVPGDFVGPVIASSGVPGDGWLYARIHEVDLALLNP